MKYLGRPATRKRQTRKWPGKSPIRAETSLLLSDCLDHRTYRRIRHHAALGALQTTRSITFDKSRLIASTASIALNKRNQINLTDLVKMFDVI